MWSERAARGGHGLATPGARPGYGLHILLSVGLEPTFWGAPGCPPSHCPSPCPLKWRPAQPTFGPEGQAYCPKAWLLRLAPCNTWQVAAEGISSSRGPQPAAGEKGRGTEVQARVLLQALSPATRLCALLPCSSVR